MAHTVNAVIYDADLHVVMQVIPDDDAQLDDPAFNPPGCTHFRVPHVPGVEPRLHPLSLARGLRLPG